MINKLHVIITKLYRTRKANFFVLIKELKHNIRYEKIHIASAIISISGILIAIVALLR
jgi:hypothetical protein